MSATGSSASSGALMPPLSGLPLVFSFSSLVLLELGLAPLVYVGLLCSGNGEGLMGSPFLLSEWVCRNPPSQYPAYLHITDIAGLIRGASEGACLPHSLACMTYISALVDSQAVASQRTLCLLRERPDSGWADDDMCFVVWCVCVIGAGLGNAFLSHIQAVDGIFHVVRQWDTIHEA